MKEEFVYYKPSLWCLLLHQAYWNETMAVEPDIYYCLACKKCFKYPTKKDEEPVYK